MKNHSKSNNLFHYTSVESFLKIIETKMFVPSFCSTNIEHITGHKLSKKYGIPEIVAICMVCFCDIPPEMSRDHKDKFGEVAIGLNKQWGLNNGLHPVSYVINESSYQKLLNTHFKSIKDSKNDNERDILLKQFSDIAAFTQMYEGQHFCKKSNDDFELSEEVEYYRECEWRYIPHEFLKELLHVVDWKDLNLNNISSKDRRGVASLKFELKDLTTIICPKNSFEIVQNAIKNIGAVDVSTWKE